MTSWIVLSSPRGYGALVGYFVNHPLYTSPSEWNNSLKCFCWYFFVMFFSCAHPEQNSLHSWDDVFLQLFDLRSVWICNSYKKLKINCHTLNISNNTNSYTDCWHQKNDFLWMSDLMLIKDGIEPLQKRASCVDTFAKGRLKILIQPRKLTCCKFWLLECVWTEECDTWLWDWSSDVFMLKPCSAI